jgi:geranylgeranyl diphosphate synthase, type II
MLRALDEAMLAALPKEHAHVELRRFYGLIGDYPLRGGKRLRGQLLLQSLRAHGGDWHVGVEVAAALELFQNWVLIHDDVEDDSEERRGRPTLHRLAGAPIAINVGDALHVYMWRALHEVRSLPPEVWCKVLDEFAWMIARTAEGQHLDLAWVGQGRFDVSEADYLEMVTLKTAYYTVVCPLRLGALCAGRAPDKRLTEAGIDLGVAFQIRDDVLNLGSEAAYGKEFAGDLFEAKRTLVLVHFFAHASKAEADEARRVLAKPRREKTPEEVTRVLALLGRHGSLRYAQEVAEARARRGLELLEEALPNAEAKELFGLLGSLASRSY